MNLKTSLSKPYNRADTLKILSLLFLAVSFLGFLDVTYLTAEHYLGLPLNCSVFEGCEQVVASKYATIGSIPVALFGAIYYLSIFLLAIFYLDTKRIVALILAVLLTPLGLSASLWFLYLQLFIIKALCLYCIISAISSTSLFILGIVTLKLLNKVNQIK